MKERRRKPPEEPNADALIFEAYKRLPPGLRELAMLVNDLTEIYQFKDDPREHHVCHPPDIDSVDEEYQLARRGYRPIYGRFHCPCGIQWTWNFQSHTWYPVTEEA